MNKNHRQTPETRAACIGMIYGGKASTRTTVCFRDVKRFYIFFCGGNAAPGIAPHSPAA
jgi:hypothetical protein